MVDLYQNFVALTSIEVAHLLFISFVHPAAIGIPLSFASKYLALKLQWTVVASESSESWAS